MFGALLKAAAADSSKFSACSLHRIYRKFDHVRESSGFDCSFNVVVKTMNDFRESKAVFACSNRIFRVCVLWILGSRCYIISDGRPGLILPHVNGFRLFLCPLNNATSYAMLWICKMTLSS